MRRCYTKIIIQAPVSKVWNILTDFERYSEWNPLIGNIRGDVHLGNTVLAKVIPLKAYFPVQIISYQANKELIWQGNVLSAGIMMGEHYYFLRALEDGTTELEHGETFTGMLSHFMPDFLLRQLEDTYQYHNEKLKIISEQGEGKKNSVLI